MHLDQPSRRSFRPTFSLRGLVTRRLLALAGLACLLTTTGGQPAEAQDDKRVAELEKKVAALEKKVAALEALLKVTPKPDLDLKLVGSWAAAEKPRAKGIAAMRFEADGKCRVVVSDDKGELETWLGVYELTGKEMQMTLNPGQFSGSGSGWRMTVKGLDDKQLRVKGNFVVTDELKFEKQ